MTLKVKERKRIGNKIENVAFVYIANEEKLSYSNCISSYSRT